MASEIPKKPLRESIFRWLGTLIAIGIVIYLIWRNWSDFIGAIRGLPALNLLLVIGLAFLSRIMVTVRWYILLRVVEPQVTLGNVFKLSFVGLFSTNVLPSTIGGDVVKLGAGRQAGWDSAGVAASLVIDRLVGMATMATFLPFGILRIIRLPPSVSMFTAGAPGHFFTHHWQRLMAFLHRTWKTLKLWFRKPMSLLGAAVCSYVHMACTFSMVVILLASLADPVSWWTAGGLWVLVYFITLIPISINGLGLQEVSLSLIFMSFGGVSETNSLVLALLMRVIFIIASLPGAFFIPGFLSPKRNSLTHKGNNG
jgi:hypothetical protein